MLDFSSQNSSHLVDEIQRLQPETSAGDSDKNWSLRNWDGSNDKVSASDTSGDQVKKDICSFSNLVQHSVSHLQGSDDGSEMHWEVRDLSHKESQETSCSVVSDFTGDHSEQGGGVMDHQAHISESIVHTSQEIIEEIGA